MSVGGGVLLLVLLGHCVSGGYGSFFRGIIFSFHMPFFFVISGFTFKCSETKHQLAVKTNKAAKKLLLPAVVCFILRTFLINAYDWIAPGLLIHFEEAIKELFYCMFWVVDKRNIHSIGMVYFCVVLFFTRIFYDGIHLLFSKYKNVMCLCLSIFGVCITEFCILPFALDMSMAMIIFFSFGNWIWENKNGIKLTKMQMMRLFMLWTGLLFIVKLFTGTYFELALRRYPVFPLSFLCALSGSCFAMGVSKLLARCRLASILRWVGERSMVFFLIHYFDRLWNILYTWTDLWPVQFIFRLAEDLILLFAIEQIRQKAIERIRKETV